MGPRLGFWLAVAALAAWCPRARAAESRDHSFSVALPPTWRMADPGKFEGDVVFAAASKEHVGETMFVSRLQVPPGMSLKTFAAGKYQAIKAKSAYGPAPSPVRAVELRKGLPPAFNFRAGDALRRFEVFYFHFDDCDYSAICPGDRAAECRAILGSIEPLRRSVWRGPALGGFRLQVPAGWSPMQDSPANFEVGRPGGQSFLLRAVDIPEAVAEAPTLEGDLKRSLTSIAPEAEFSRLRKRSLAGGRVKAVWVAGDRGAQGWLLSGVVWSGGKSYRLAVVSRAPAERVAESILSSWTR